MILAVLAVLNMQVTYQQGINYEVRTVKIPLYLKIIDFISRDYHYKETVRAIVGDNDSQNDKALKIFSWTYNTIKPIPEGFPVIDDHAWHIIIRGYGTEDQACDVFATLCNYAGLEAYFSFLDPQKGSRKLPLAFVRIEGKWRIFDPAHAVYFENKQGNFADVEEVGQGNYLLEAKPGQNLPDYPNYLKNLPSIKDMGLSRANIQSPFRRFLYELKKRLTH